MHDVLNQEWPPFRNVHTTQVRSVYEVCHATIYSYAHPVTRSEHWLRLRPVQDKLQTLHDFHLRLNPDAKSIDYRDCFDNELTYVLLHDPYQRLEIESRFRVTVTQPIFPDKIPYLGLGTFLPSEQEILAPYRLPDSLPESQLRELAHYAHHLVEKAPRGSLPLLIDSICTSIYQDFAYQSGSTQVNTTAYEVYCLKRGVCQDFSVLMINLLRLLQIPARYRTGYLHTGLTTTNHAMADASHAWVEVFLPRAGWFGWDPTVL